MFKAACSGYAHMLRPVGMLVKTVDACAGLYSLQGGPYLAVGKGIQLVPFKTGALWVKSTPGDTLGISDRPPH